MPRHPAVVNDDVPIRRVFGSTIKKSYHSGEGRSADYTSEAGRHSIEAKSHIPSQLTAVFILA
jgi:hypothetical protein